MQYRNVMLENRDEANRTVEASLSSETPYYRPDAGHETLRHTPEAIDLSRAPLPLLTSHDSRQTPVGIIENIRIVGGKLRGLLRFGGSQRALDAWEDVKAGVLRSISVGYQVHKTERSGDDSYTVTRWMPYEASLVSVPADPTVGIGRSIQRIDIMDHQEVSREEGKLSRNQRRAANADDVDNSRAGRVREIMALARQFNMPEHLVSEYIDQRDCDVQGFRDRVSSSIRDTGKLRPSEDAELGLTGREIERYSFVNAILAQMDPTARRNAGFELECSRAYAQKIGREPTGIYVPRDVLMQKRDLLVGTASAGGNLVATQHLASAFIEIQRSRCHVARLGATYLTDLNGNVAIPSQVGPVTTYWVTENSPVLESQQTFGQVNMTPKTVGGFVDYSRKMLLQASPEIEQLVRMDLASCIAVELDRVAVAGSGVGAEPRGILNSSGIGSVAIGTNGGAPTWAHMLDLERALAVASADTLSMAYLTNPKVRRKLKETLKVSGDAGAGFIWESITADEPGWGRVNGYRAATTTNVPSDLDKGTSVDVCSAMILANWSDLLIGLWGGLDIIVDPYTGATAGTQRVVALQDVDIAIRRPASFAVIEDILAA